MNLTLDEMETVISQTAEERRRGIWRVYTDDPYWMRRMDERGRLTKTERSGGRHYEIDHRQITLRNPRNTDESPDNPQSDESGGQCDMEPVP